MKWNEVLICDIIGWFKFFPCLHGLDYIKSGMFWWKIIKTNLFLYINIHQQIMHKSENY